MNLTYFRIATMQRVKQTTTVKKSYAVIGIIPLVVERGGRKHTVAVLATWHLFILYHIFIGMNMSAFPTLFIGLSRIFAKYRKYLLASYSGGIKSPVHLIRRQKNGDINCFQPNSLCLHFEL